MDGSVALNYVATLRSQAHVETVPKEASMASTSLHLPVIPLGPRAIARHAPATTTVLGALRALFSHARPSRIDREVAALIEGSGGKFTDSLERAIERRLFERH
jgi:hypothetical protein